MVHWLQEALLNDWQKAERLVALVQKRSSAAVIEALFAIGFT